ncbi:MAG: AMP-binding protein, partial [Gemmatimonadetes bacterium]|nr:long-chain fatty acid--CoA ligase [Gemmatimonadota bacterium]NIU76141.1 AMP-binding protein [Gammaproteobacteria bacterium]NIV56586.1 AMP-binding protein [Actinomycetota bacterium]NIQ55948.1 long-chain fatty acid--CoA ligase [Gemmatimonadota bacterium]NIW38492.1 AMP-binding protein [Gemmatimonadota bacterium]
VLPLYHIFAVGVVVQSALLSGSSIMLMERFEPEGVLRALEEHDVTILYGVPTMYVMLLRQAQAGHVLPDTLR